MSEINYSIIIPHKNSAALLKRCLDSIPYRDDIQIIVIDDNSTDVSELHNIENQYKNVEIVYTTDGRGAGFARNKGLDKAVGKWLLFADADDFFNEGFLDYTDKYLNSDNDIVFFNSDSRFSDSLESCPPRMPRLNKYIENHDLDSLRYLIPVVWGKMYSREFIIDHRIYFEEVPVSNDVLFAFMSSNKAKTMDICEFNLYCSTINRTSLCHRQTKEMLDCRFFVDLHVNILKLQANVPYSQNNILSHTLYYSNYGTKVFAKAIIRFILLTPPKMIWWNIKVSIPRLFGSIKRRKLLELK